uniref:CAZy families GH15 protein n=1 Tax=uncultured Actinosynnema sp. TaxID=905025 RepID=A0A060CCS4_9PSEU|nr:CAZy families GH15 protein [uncultured Actinosynnema sp.]
MSAELDTAVRRIVEVPRLLVALDFDGTVAPFTDNPADSRSLADAHLAVIRLWQLRQTTVAYVSGRALDSLRAVADAPRGAAAGRFARCADAARRGRRRPSAAEHADRARRL